jgi:hypothetical protein
MNRPEEEPTVAPHWILRRPWLDPKTLQNARNLKTLDTTFGRQDEFQISIQMISLRRSFLHEQDADVS